jgi:hypothetical protein
MTAPGKISHTWPVKPAATNAPTTAPVKTDLFMLALS